MIVRIEAGKYYKTRDGRKVGPMVKNTKAEDQRWLSIFPWTCLLEEQNCWTDEGRFLTHHENSLDLIAEWTETPQGPVRTKTVTEIVPGVHGIVSVKENHPRYENSVNIYIQPTHATKNQLIAAVLVLNQLAEALEE